MKHYTEDYIRTIPLTEFMKALGKEPVESYDNLLIYNAPYRYDEDVKLVVNIETNRWRDVKTGYEGDLHNLAYTVLGSDSEGKKEKYIDYIMTNMEQRQKQERGEGMSVAKFERIMELMVKVAPVGEKERLTPGALQECANFIELSDLIKKHFGRMNAEIAHVIVDNAEAFRSVGIYVNEHAQFGYMVCNVGEHTVEAPANVFAFDKAKVVNRGSYEDREPSYIYLHGRADAHTFGRANVWVYDESTVYGDDATNVKAHGKSKVECREWARVEAYDHARVTAKGYSKVLLLENSHCDAFDESIVDARDNSSVDAHDYSNVNSSENTVVRAFGEYVNLRGKETISLKQQRREDSEQRVVGKLVETKKDCKFYLHASAGPLGDTPKAQISYKDHVMLQCKLLTKQDLADKYLGAAMQDLFDGKYKVSEKTSETIAYKGPKR